MLKRGSRRCLISLVERRLSDERVMYVTYREMDLIEPSSIIKLLHRRTFFFVCSLQICSDKCPGFDIVRHLCP